MNKSYLEVNLSNISSNIRKIKEKVGKEVELVPVIKADAYGIGATKLKKVLEENNIKMVAVATIQEGIELRKENFNMEILTLNELLPYEAENIIKYNLVPGVSDLEVVKELEKQANINNKKIKVHIEIDTGMGRVGLNPKDALNFVKEISKFQHIEIEGIYTHFSSADSSTEYTNMQIEVFEKVLEQLNKNEFNFKYIHSSASSAILNFPNAKFNMVRPGIITYGYMPDSSIENTIGLLPCTKLISHVVFVKEIEVGTAIGYGRTYIANQKRKIATIPLGYADGISRLLSNKGSVYINGKLAKIVGNICMDNFMIDVTGIDVETGDKVYMWDNENITVEEIANICGTINYEILCGISKRVERKYI